MSNTSKRKKKGVALDVKTIQGNSGDNYIFFRTPYGSYNVFVEVQAKDAVIDCGASQKNRNGKPKNLRAMCREVWDNNK